MLDSKLLGDFIDNFFGYGNLKAPVWFIGMEEGGGSSEDELARRLRTWHDEGHQRPLVADLAQFHVDFGDSTRFGDNPRIQSTWGKLIRTLLVAQGIKPTTERVRQHQKAKLGRSDGDSALLELMPLPRPSMTEWDYDTWSDCPELNSFATYEVSVRPKRIAAIRKLIAGHAPRVVIFYGTGYTAHWEAIAGLPFPHGDYPRVAGTTPLFMVLPHPVAFGRVNRHYETAGRILFDMGVFPPR